MTLRRHAAGVLLAGALAMLVLANLLPLAWG